MSDFIIDVENKGHSKVYHAMKIIPGTIEEHTKAQGYNVAFSSFELPIDLEEKPSPLSTYTVIDNKTDKKYLLSGCNVIVETFHAVIRK